MPQYDAKKSLAEIELAVRKALKSGTFSRRDFLQTLSLSATSGLVGLLDPQNALAWQTMTAFWQNIQNNPANARSIEDLFSTYLYTGNGGTQVIDNGIILGSGASSPGWSARLAGTSADHFLALCSDSSGNIYAAGNGDSSTGGANQEAFITKWDGSGNLLWQKKIGGAGGDYFNSLCSDSSGNVYAAGYENSSAGNAEALITKWDGSGNLLWQKKIGGAGSDFFNSLCSDSSGNVYAAGNENSSTGSNTEALITKWDGSGNLLWQKKIGGANDDNFKALCSDSSGNVYATGYEYSSTGGANIEAPITKWDNSGNLLWQKKIGGAGTDYFFALCSDSSGNVYAAGRESSNAGNYGAFLTRVLPDGGMGNAIVGRLAWGDPGLTVGNPALTAATPSLTVGNPALTAGNPALTVGDPGLIATRYPWTEGAGYGGLVWIKKRNNTQSHFLFDTVRGTSKALSTDSTAAEASGYSLSYGAGGLVLNSSSTGNNSSDSYAAWTFRKAPKFFDIVTYTGDGTTSRTLNHDLAIAPGFIIFKSRSSSRAWIAFAKNGTVYDRLYLNTTDSRFQQCPSSAITANTLDLRTLDTYASGGVYDQLNNTGESYIAYLFAHDPDPTNGVIQCGVAGPGTEPISVTLGWEPQWVLIKAADGTGDWHILDSQRGAGISDDKRIFANLTTQESTGNDPIDFNNTGFIFRPSHMQGTATASNQFVYVAIRRGPMRAPTAGTQVFNAMTRTNTQSAVTVSGVGFSPDLFINGVRSHANYGQQVIDRVRGISHVLFTDYVNAETTYGVSAVTSFDRDGISLGADTAGTGLNSYSGYTVVNYFFRRAPQFFDIVAYTGSGAQSITHGLGSTPELMLVKIRTTGTSMNWDVYHSALGPTGSLALNTANANSGPTANSWNNTSPTPAVFTVGYNNSLPGYTYIAYLFASCPGVSKIGSYSGSASNVAVSCGFTPRFILIKRTDSTGDWYVWDSARGITSSAGNDPYLLFNSSAAEVTGTDYIDLNTGTGFTVKTGNAALNTNGGTYLFFAIS